MADVKWIRICTDMINNKKIKRIRTMPEGNNIVLIWVFLIAQAGESNRGGGLFLTDTIPFTHEDLAVEFGFEIPVIQLALITLEKFSMIEVYDDVIYIKNWEEYQNSDGLEKIREQGRERAKKFREKKKQELLTTDSNAKDNVTVTLRNAIEEELELELDKEKDIKKDCINDFFERIWKLYPEKRNGKSTISDSNKKELYKIGLDEMKRAIERYSKEVYADREGSFKERSFKAGSTFFKGHYKDYLDANYEEQAVKEKENINDGISNKKKLFEEWANG